VASDLPYQVAKPDPYDGWSGNPHRRWSATVTSSAIEKHWPALGNLTSITINQRDGFGQWNGRVLSMTLHGSSHDVPLTGSDFRIALGLQSTWFTLTTAG
jgi:peptidoglycan hydrolase-like amidase